MPFNGSGVFQRIRNWVADATAGVKIRADYHDAEDDGFAEGLSHCITKDGQTTITQNIPWNNKRITGLQDPVDNQDAATKASVMTLTADKLPLSGGTLTGDLTIKKDGPTLILDDTDTADIAIVGQRHEKNRWRIVLGDNTAESGANAGANFKLQRYADDGTLIDAALDGTRSTGLMTVKGDPTAALGIATKGYTDAAITAGITGKVNRAGDTMTGALQSAGSGAAFTGGSLSGSFNVINTAGYDAAYMTFYASGFFGANFGLRSDGNFYMGGVSHGNNIYKFWTTRDFASAPVRDVRLTYAGDYTAAADTLVEPYPGAVVTGIVYWRGFPDLPINSVGGRYRWLQIQTTAGFVTVGLG